MKYVLASFLILILGLLGVLNPLRDVFQLIFTPVEVGLGDIGRGVVGSFDFFKNLKAIREENLHLLSEVEDLKAAVIDIKLAADENKVLKDQLALKNKDTFDKKLILASVLGNKEDAAGTTLVLDKGSRHGISVGANVVRGKFLVGVVSYVTAEKSVVTLVTSPQLLAAVYDLDSPQRAAGLMQGQYGSSILMKRVLPNEELKVGDTIVTSGKDGLFIPGLIVGTISELVNNSSEPLKSVYLNASVSLNDLDKVFIIYE